MKSNDATNKKYWDRVAGIYTAFMKRNHHLFKEISNEASVYLNDNMDILELACGTGQCTFSMCRQVRTWMATDYAEAMVLETKKRATAQRADNVTVRKEDATNLSFEDESFHGVIIANALHIMPEPQKALEEIYRVLKPNGLLVAPTFVFDTKINKIKILLLKITGFKVFYQWTSTELGQFIKDNGFRIKKTRLVKARPLQEYIVIAKTICKD